MGIDINVDMDLASDRTVSINWGSFQGSDGAPLKGFGGGYKVGVEPILMRSRWLLL